jgi:thiosulfate reductase cytochrome b subunit
MKPEGNTKLPLNKKNITLKRKQQKHNTKEITCPNKLLYTDILQTVLPLIYVRSIAIRSSED